MDEEQPETFVVSESHAGVRLDQFLAEFLEISRAHARRLLGDGLVELDDRPVKEKDKGRSLALGAVVRVGEFRMPEDQRTLPESADNPSGAVVGVLASGDGWLAVDKRPGFPVHPLREGETGTVLNVVTSMHPEVHGVGEGGLRSGVVHRLDVDTSGVLLVAIAQPAWDRLREAFRSHVVEKTYRAIVAGNLREPIDQEVGLVVAQHRPARVRVTDIPETPEASGVRAAVQQVRPLEQLPGASLVEIRPRTGFLHQIRATLADLGHPVLGDEIYGDDEIRRRAPRHLLHAAELRFENVRVTSPDPQDFTALLQKLRG